MVYHGEVDSNLDLPLEAWNASVGRLRLADELNGGAELFLGHASLLLGETAESSS